MPAVPTLQTKGGDDYFRPVANTDNWNFMNVVDHEDPRKLGRKAWWKSLGAPVVHFRIGSVRRR